MMLLLTLFSFFVILLRPVVANSEHFGLLVIRSGSPLQYAGVYSHGDHLYLGNTNRSLSAVVTDCGFVLFDDGSYAAVGSSGEIKESTLEEATDTFAIRNGHLTLYNVDGFEAVPKGGKFLFSTKSTSNSLGIIIRAQSLQKGYKVPDFVPANNCSTRTKIPSGLDTVVENYSLNGSTSAQKIYSNPEDGATELKNPWKISMIATILAALML